MDEEYSLCKSCKFVLTCDRALEQNKKVYYCENYQPSINSDLPKKNLNLKNNNCNKNNMKNGLCRICENRDVCQVQIPNGGLWHCENFV